MAAALGRAGFAVITGGGPGLMEAANRGARDAGIQSIGLNIALPQEQAPNPYLDLSLTFEHFFARRIMFVRYASAFVVLPGGLGTIDEMFEALMVMQTGKISNFPVVLEGTQHWAGLVGWMHERLLDAGRIDAPDLALLHVTDDPAEVADIVTRCHAAQCVRSMKANKGASPVERHMSPPRRNKRVFLVLLLLVVVAACGRGDSDRSSDGTTTTSEDTTSTTQTAVVTTSTTVTTVEAKERRCSTAPSEGAKPPSDDWASYWQTQPDANQPLVLEICLDDVTPEVGQRVILTVTADDPGREHRRGRLRHLCQLSN